MPEPVTRQFYLSFSTQICATSVAEAIQTGLTQFENGNVLVTVTSDVLGEVHEFVGLPATTALQAYALKPSDHSSNARKVLLERLKLLAPGFYIERDGGNWYCVGPGDIGRVGEDFVRPTDALRLILTLAGEPLPDGWKIKPRTGTLSADIDCGQGFDACLWRRDAAKVFPDRLRELLP